jgi:uncharacterized membrane protein (UPF0136 family)
MFKKTTCWIVLLYGVMLTVLGYVGYYNAGSKASLIMGSGFGILMILSALLLFAKKQVGVYSSTIITLMLTATFAVRYTTSMKTIPAVLAVISGGMLIFLLAQSAKWKTHK